MHYAFIILQCFCHMEGAERPGNGAPVWGSGTSRDSWLCSSLEGGTVFFVERRRAFGRKLGVCEAEPGGGVSPPAAASAHVVPAGALSRGEGHQDMKISPIFSKASLKIFRYALLLLWIFFPLFFKLHEFIFKALCSVYFLENITWLYVYCKYIKYYFCFYTTSPAWLFNDTTTSRSCGLPHLWNNTLSIFSILHIERRISYWWDCLPKLELQQTAISMFFNESENEVSNVFIYIHM